VLGAGVSADTASPAGEIAQLDRPVVPAGRRRVALTAVLEQYGLVVICFVAFGVFSVLLPSTFPTVGNVKAMVESQAVIVPLAIAETLPLRVGDFDLSIAGLMVAAGALLAQLTTHGVGLGAAIAVVFGFSLAVGVINGLLVVKVGIDSFITTLGMMTLLSGLAYAFTNSNVITGLPSNVLTLARQNILGFPSFVWVGWALVVVAWYVYEHTPFGRSLLFIGGSREAARLAGLRVDRLRISAFVMCSLIAGATGVLFAGSVGQLDPSVASQFLLQPFAGVFLGTTTIVLGRFNAFGTLVALYLLVIGVTGLQLYGAQPWVSDAFNGAALVAAVAFAKLAARANARRR